MMSGRGQAVNATVADSVALELRGRIVDGTLPGGERLRQDAVSREFGVSQTIAREAFRLLQGEGFLDIEPRKGARIRPLSSGEVLEITALRRLLEAQALEWAIPALTETDFASAEAVLAELDTATAVDDLLDLNARFHEILYARCPALRTLRLIGDLRLAFERYLRVTWAETPRRSTSQEEHREILSLCRERKTAPACDCLKAHINRTGTVLVARLRELEAAETS